MPANSQQSWREAYCPTVNLSDICHINEFAAVSLDWESSESLVSYALNTFHADRDYTLSVSLLGNAGSTLLAEDSLVFAPLGHTDTIMLSGLNLPSGCGWKPLPITPTTAFRYSPSTAS